MLFKFKVKAYLCKNKEITPRISPFTTATDIGGLLSSSGFKLLTLDFDEIRIAYPSIFELMYDVKGNWKQNEFIVYVGYEFY